MKGQYNESITQQYWLKKPSHHDSQHTHKMIKKVSPPFYPSSLISLLLPSLFIPSLLLPLSQTIYLMRQPLPFTPDMTSLPTSHQRHPSPHHTRDIPPHITPETYQTVSLCHPHLQSPGGCCCDSEPNNWWLQLVVVCQVQYPDGGTC